MSADASAAPALLIPDAAPVFAPNELPLVQSAEPPATPNITDKQHQRNAAARELANKLTVDANGDSVVPPAAPPPAAPPPAAPAKTEAKPTEPAAKPAEKPAEPKTEPRANTVTERIGDLTRKNRELSTARKALETQLAAKDAEIAKAVADAKAAGASEYKATLRDKFKADAPGTIREELEEDWIAVIQRVADGGPAPTPAELEAKAAADKLKKIEEAHAAEAKATADRIKKLEDERAAEKKALDDAKAKEDAARKKTEDEKKYANSVKWIAEKVIDPVKHPNLVNIREDVAEEVMSAVSDAIQAAQSPGPNGEPPKWPRDRNGKFIPLTEERAGELAGLAADGLQNYYSDLVSKAATGSTGSRSSAPQTATATETEPAVSTAPVPQSRPPTTITSAVAGGETPRAANPVARSVLDAKEAAIAAARRLPPLSTE